MNSNQFETIGRWWDDQSVELVKIDGDVFALNLHEWRIIW